MPSVTRKTKTSRQDRRKEVTRRLLEGLEALLEEGETFTEVSVERLVKQTGISRSTFYVYYEDKGELLRALAADVTVDFLEACQDWWTLPPRRTRDELRTAFERMYDAYRPHRSLMAALVESTSYDPAVRDEYQTMMDTFVKGVAKHIKDGQKAGQVDAVLDPARTAAWLTWMIERGLYQFAGGAGNAERGKALSAMTDVIWNALYAPATTA